jgi:putative tricarboxylic transport membrane protein
MVDENVRRWAVRAPQELAVGAVLMGIALITFWGTSDLDVGRLGAMGPGMLPRAIATVLGLIGLALIVISCLKRGDPLERWSMRGPLFITAGVIAFALTIRPIGLAVAGPLVAIISGAASPETRFKELLVFAFVMTVLCAGLFRFVLHLPIPILVIPGVVVL